MDPRTQRLLAWYDRHARRLPWRGSRDPYRIWVSEIMLQQTRVETVADRYYDRFLSAFPTLEALAGAEEAEVLKQWEGLGYYSRARNLLAGARQVQREYGGRLPADPAALRGIRGIGPYTAGAIASIAFGIPVPAVDGNVIRVISRLYGVEENQGAPGVRGKMEALAAALVPAERPGDWNQAVMDLGAAVCVPGTPDCEVCPLRGLCAAEKKGLAAELPRMPGRKPPREIRYDLLILYAGERVLMRMRTEKMLQGLWCFPMEEGWRTGGERAAEIFRKWGWQTGEPVWRGEAKHVFTHQIWRMSMFEMEAPPDSEAPKGYALIPLTDLSRLPVPTAMKAAMALVREHGEMTGKSENNGENTKKMEKKGEKTDIR